MPKAPNRLAHITKQNPERGDFKTTGVKWLNDNPLKSADHYRQKLIFLCLCVG